MKQKIINFLNYISMNKKEKIFVVNNQEDEDGYSLNPGNMTITENARDLPAKQPRNNPVNNKTGVIKAKPGGLYISAGMSEKK
jgi:hypothetical protein